MDIQILRRSYSESKIHQINWEPKKISRLSARLCRPLQHRLSICCTILWIESISVTLPESALWPLTGVGVCFPIIILITAFSSLIGMGGALGHRFEWANRTWRKRNGFLATALRPPAPCATLTALFLCRRPDISPAFSAQAAIHCHTRWNI